MGRMMKSGINKAPKGREGYESQLMKKRTKERTKSPVDYGSVKPKCETKV